MPTEKFQPNNFQIKIHKNCELCKTRLQGNYCRKCKKQMKYYILKQYLGCAGFFIILFTILWFIVDWLVGK